MFYEIFLAVLAARAVEWLLMAIFKTVKDYRLVYKNRQTIVKD